MYRTADPPSYLWRLVDLMHVDNSAMILQRMQDGHLRFDGLFREQLAFDHLDGVLALIARTTAVCCGLLHHRVPAATELREDRVRVLDVLLPNDL